MTIEIKFLELFVKQPLISKYGSGLLLQCKSLGFLL